MSVYKRYTLGLLVAGLCSLKHPNHSNATAAVPTHFNLPGHSSKDMRLIPLELQRPSSNGSRRKAREAYLIERGRTLSPNGLNRRNER